MAARGAAEKAEVQSKILALFPNAFPYDKHIRVPVGDVQIKITLTAAKDIVGEGADTALPGEEVVTSPVATAVPAQQYKEPTEQEKQNIQKLLASLNL